MVLPDLDQRNMESRYQPSLADFQHTRSNRVALDAI